jgi:Acyl carrier protein
MDKQQIFEEISQLLTQQFDILSEKITPDARLYEDMELDSIDAVDIVAHLQKKTGKKVKPETFKSVRTVQDIVNAVEELLRSE